MEKVIAWPGFRHSKRNAYTKLLYTAVQSQSNSTDIIEFGKKTIFTPNRGSILHLHWPDAFINQARTQKLAHIRRYALMRLLDYYRRNGVRIIWTAHNFKRGGDDRMVAREKDLWEPLTDRLDGIIFMTKVSRNEVLQDMPKVGKIPYAIIPHGNYSDTIPDPRPTPLHSNFLFFGPLTPYKNVSSLVKAYGELSSSEPLSLRISGGQSSKSPDHKFESSLAALSAEKRSHIIHEDVFQSDADLAARVFGADLVVLPFLRVMNSGSALYTLTCGTPILAPRMPLFEELQNYVGAKWIMLYDGALKPSDLEQAWKSAVEIKASGEKPKMDNFCWSSIGKKTVDFYRKILEI